MIPVYMTRFFDPSHNRPGNALSACIAALLETGIENVPWFEEAPPVECLDRLQVFLQKHRRTLVIGNGQPFPNEYAIAIGRISSSVTHACLFFGTRLVHNPHPLDVPMMSIARFVAVRHVPRRKKSAAPESRPAAPSSAASLPVQADAPKAPDAAPRKDGSITRGGRDTGDALQARRHTA